METNYQQNYSSSENTPNSIAVLVLGIISIVMCSFIGLILGIIALSLASKDMQLVNENPNRYSASSINNLKAGKTCAVIGISLSALATILLIVYLLAISAIFTTAFNNF